MRGDSKGKIPSEYFFVLIIVILLSGIVILTLDLFSEDSLDESQVTSNTRGVSFVDYGFTGEFLVVVLENNDQTPLNIFAFEYQGVFCSEETSDELPLFIDVGETKEIRCRIN